MLFEISAWRRCTCAPSTIDGRQRKWIGNGFKDYCFFFSSPHLALSIFNLLSRECVRFVYGCSGYTYCHTIPAAHHQIFRSTERSTCGMLIWTRRCQCAILANIHQWLRTSYMHGHDTQQWASHRINNNDYCARMKCIEKCPDYRHHHSIQCDAAYVHAKFEFIGILPNRSRVELISAIHTLSTNRLAILIPIDCRVKSSPILDLFQNRMKNGFSNEILMTELPGVRTIYLWLMAGNAGCRSSTNSI